MSLSTFAFALTRSASCRALPLVALFCLTTGSAAFAQSLKTMPQGRGLWNVFLPLAHSSCSLSIVGYFFALFV